MPKLPGGKIASRPLHFIWILDCSQSMKSDGKIQALNNAIRETIPHMRRVAKDNPNADVRVRAITFSSTAQWHPGSEPTPVAQFTWTDVQAKGRTATGAALKLLASALSSPPMESRALPPVLVLVSDGRPTDDFAAGLDALMAQPWGEKAVRIAIAIGRDAVVENLEEFIGDSPIEVLLANNPEALVQNIRWASTTILSGSLPSGSDSRASGRRTARGTVPAPITLTSERTADDGW